MRRDKQCCGKCDAWVVDAHQLGSNRQGTCRIEGPKAFPLQARGPTGAPAVVYQAVFPPMLEGDWCHRWTEITTINVTRETSEELKQLDALDPGKVMWKS